MQFESDVALSEWCTLRVGGPARYFCTARSEADILAALDWADTRRLAVHILGGGSNVVTSDDGFDGLVIRIAIDGVNVSSDGEWRVYRVGAGEPWDPFVARTVHDDCAGLECLSGIPGLVGGTPIQNVGAYGQDVSGSIRSVRVIDRAERQAVTMPAAECRFAYRHSRFKSDDAGRFVVTGVEFALQHRGAPTISYADVVNHFAARGDGQPSLADVRSAILEIRRRKGMVIEPGNPANESVGSFFVNPVIGRDRLAAIAATPAAGGGSVPHYPVDDARVKVPAAWLIERSGFPRGRVFGRAGISPFQAQGLINRGGARAEDIIALALAVKRAVWQTFDVAIVPEPVFVGFSNREDIDWLLGRVVHS